MASYLFRDLQVAQTLRITTLLRFASLFIAAFSVSTAYGQNCSYNDIAGRVCVLQQNYNPVPGVGRPIPNCTADNMGTWSAKVAEAWTRAPIKVKNDLCTIDKFIVLMSNDLTSSWGKWEDPRYYDQQCGHACSYIGVGRYAFTTEIDKVYDQRLFWSGSDRIKHHYDQQTTSLSEAQTIGLLATLAHEMAHVKFRRDDVRNSFCFTNNIFNPYSIINLSWDLNPGEDLLVRTQRWLPFHATHGHHKYNVPMPTQNSSAYDLYLIYQNGFTTQLSSASPEEDYVEAYSLYAISDRMSAVGVNLTATIQGYQPFRLIFRDFPTQTVTYSKSVPVRPMDPELSFAGRSGMGDGLGGRVANHARRIAAS